MSDTFLMGCGAGFSGDRVDAPQSVVAAIAASGKPGAIMFETLAERTLALGQLARLADPEKGYDPLLYAFLPSCLSVWNTESLSSATSAPPIRRRRRG